MPSLTKKLEHPITRQILLKCHNLFIVFCWSHILITGDEKADKSTKAALNKQVLHIPNPVPYTDLKPIINKCIHTRCQQDWNSQGTQNKLQQFFPNPLYLPHFNEEIKSYIIDCILDTNGYPIFNCSRHQRLVVVALDALYKFSYLLTYVVIECVSYNQT